jgi:predicted nuclease of predicted toxin-antitoxin system
VKFFLDQDVYFQTTRFLRDLGHDVVLAGDLGLSQAEDSEIMLSARDAGRILVILVGLGKTARRLTS